MPHPQLSRRLCLASLVHDDASRAPMVEPGADGHAEVAGADGRRSAHVILSRGGDGSSGAHHGVPAGTQNGPGSYPESGVSGYRRVEACVGIACALVCVLTDLPWRGLHALVEALR